MSITGGWGTALGVLAALAVLEFFITNRFGLFGFGILVWRERRDSFPAGSPGESRSYGGDLYYMASADRWLIQRRGGFLFATWLQYKGMIRRDGDGALATVRVPLFPVLLFAAMLPAALAQTAPAPDWIWMSLAVPLLHVGYGWFRGRDATESLR